MVEIISPPDSPIIVVFAHLIAVTKFGRGSPLTGPQIQQYEICAILSRCVKGAYLETVQDSYNRGPSKKCMSSSSGVHFHQSCHVTMACVSLS